MVVIHEYTHTPPGMEEPPEEPLPEEQIPVGEEISEEKAFWVGLSVVIFGIVLVLVAIVGRVIWSHRQLTQLPSENQVLGTQTPPVNNQPLNINQQNTASAEKEIVSGGIEYTVQSGDTLATIGEKYGVEWKKIAQINKIEEPYTVKTGQKLIIPVEVP